MDPQRRPAWSPFFTTERAVAAHSRPTLRLTKLRRDHSPEHSPADAPSWWRRLARRTLDTEVGFVLVVAIIWLGYVLFGNFAEGLGQNISSAVSAVAVLLIFGVFLGVIVVTEESPKYRSSGNRVRIVCGGVAGIAVATIFGASWEGLVLAAFIGGMLGHFGKHWAQQL